MFQKVSTHDAENRAIISPPGFPRESVIWAHHPLPGPGGFGTAPLVSVNVPFGTLVMHVLVIVI